MIGVAVGRAGLGSQPDEQLVAQEAQFAAAREPMGGHLPLAHELAQVLHVDLEQFGGERSRQHWWKVVHVSSRLQERAT